MHQTRTYVLLIILTQKSAFVKGVFEKKMKKDMKLTSFLSQYAENDTFRAHMPGHKGRALPEFPELSGAYAWDITEITGADSLLEADGILREGERRTAALYSSADCCWSAGGSTLCIQAMLAKMRTEHRRVIAGRTVHRAFLNACILLGLSVEWVWPREGSLIAGRYDLGDFERILRRVSTSGEKACIYVTSPDYCGNMQDIAALSRICRRYDARLLVDNAHGAHLAFFAENKHPIVLGADFCCDSAHKMLPALTGAAMLHCAEPCGMEMKQFMTLFGSTSPSYLIMQSIEAAMAYLSEEGTAGVQWCAQRSDVLRSRLSRFDFVGDDPLHLTIRADGNALAKALRAHNVECEYADSTCAVLLLSPVMKERDFRRLEQALEMCAAAAPLLPPALPEPPEQVCTMRQAALSVWECVPIDTAVGRICGAVQVPCPPAVPLLVSGERITGEWAELMRFYGIGEVLVMRL